LRKTPDRSRVDRESAEKSEWDVVGIRGHGGGAVARAAARADSMTVPFFSMQVRIQAPIGV
jgi:hypothetical protein